MEMLQDRTLGKIYYLLDVILGFFYLALKLEVKLLKLPHKSRQIEKF